MSRLDQSTTAGESFHGWPDMLPEMRGEVRRRLSFRDQWRLSLTCKREQAERDAAVWRDGGYRSAFLRSLCKEDIMEDMDQLYALTSPQTQYQDPGFVAAVLVRLRAIGCQGVAFGVWAATLSGQPAIEMRRNVAVLAMVHWLSAPLFGPSNASWLECHPHMLHNHHLVDLARACDTVEMSPHGRRTILLAWWVEDVLCRLDMVLAAESSSGADATHLRQVIKSARYDLDQFIVLLLNYAGGAGAHFRTVNMPAVMARLVGCWFATKDEEDGRKPKRLLRRAATDYVTPPNRNRKRKAADPDAEMARMHRGEKVMALVAEAEKRYAWWIAHAPPVPLPEQGAQPPHHHLTRLADEFPAVPHFRNDILLYNVDMVV